MMICRSAIHVMSGVLASVLLAGTAYAQPGSQDLNAVLGRVADAEHGKKLYETCAACHGPKGEGVSDGTVPAIAGQPFAVLAKQLTDFRRGARLDPRMQHFADTTHLSYSQEIADVASYISKMPPRVSPADSSAASGRGAMVYQRKCERCHGTVGEGSDVGFAPRLAGQHADYLIRQLTAEAGVRSDLKSAHAGLAGSLSRDDIADLAKTLSTL